MTLKLYHLSVATSSTFLCLVQVIPIEEREFGLATEERENCIVAILRTAIGATAIVIGDTFKNESTGDEYRITKIADQPIDIAVRFTCETDS